MSEKVVVIWSGGMDSTALLFAEREQGNEVFGISVNYGQRHSKELDAARGIAADYDINHLVVDATGIKAAMLGSALTDNEIDVPEGHYADESMKDTVVPNRNMMLISLGIAHAISVGAKRVAYAAHAGDHAVYPDCRPAFADAMHQAASVCDYEPIELSRPFVYMDKGEVCAAGLRAGAPLERTWSCYNGRELHCGKCGTCVERIEAFGQANAEDRTEYEKSLA
tara:strand:+ start:122 stop:793 length:672 start_codon:yes stop_codon:yes gene_type:complete